MNTITTEAKTINMKTAILDAERLNKQITVYYHERRMIDKFKCFDTPKCIVLNNTCLHGGLLYWKRSQFEWKNISIDDIDRIEIDGKTYAKA